MRRLVGRFLRDRSGAAVVEYGLIAAGLTLAIVTVMQGVGVRIAMNSALAETPLR